MIGLRLQAVERGPRVVDHDLELRNAHLLFDLQVGKAFDAWRAAPRNSSASGAQRIEVFAEELDGDLRPHAREHVIEPVRDGLADIERRPAARTRRARRSAMIASLLRPPSFRSTSISEEWTPSACSSSSARPVRRPTALTSGTSRMSFSAIRPDAVGLGERDAGIEQHVDGEGALIEGRQERARQQRSAPMPPATTATQRKRHDAAAAGRRRAPAARGWRA